MSNHPLCYNPNYTCEFKFNNFEGCTSIPTNEDSSDVNEQIRYNKIASMKEDNNCKKRPIRNPMVGRNKPRTKSLRWRCKPTKGRTSTTRMEPILKQPVGVAFGTFNIKDFLDSHPSAESANDVEKKGQMLLLQGYATCLIAFGETYITPEDEWTSHTLNRILCEGKNHLQKSSKSFEGESQQVESISKCFNLCGNAMEVKISLPILIGRIECPNSRVYSLRVGLSMFMSKYKHALLRTEDRFYLIWRKPKVYFLFDCYGRSVDLRRDTEHGNVALICVCSSKGIDSLLSYMGGLSSQSAYTLYEIRMKRLMPCCENPIVCTGSGRRADFEVISNDHARLAGVCHIGSECFGESRYKQALAVGLISIIYSKIDGPCTWDSNIIDKIIIMGDRHYKEWTEFNPEKCLTIEDIPGKFQIGQFRAHIAFSPEAASGDWVLRADKHTQDISKSIRDIFENKKFSGILVQLDGKVYALFLRHSFYYLFDPYPPNILKAKYGARKHATLHMFNNLNLLCCIFTQEILNLSLPCKFLIHVIKIIDLVNSSTSVSTNDAPLLCSGAEIDWDLPEIESLNESIYDIHCEPIRKCIAEEFDIGVCDLDVPPFTEFQNGSADQLAKSVSTLISESADSEEKDEDDDGENEEETLEEEEEDFEEEKHEDSSQEEDSETARQNKVKAGSRQRKEHHTEEEETDDDKMTNRQHSKRNKSRKPNKSKPSDILEDENNRNSRKQKAKKKEKVSKSKRKEKDQEEDADTDEAENTNKAKTKRKHQEKLRKNKAGKNRVDRSDVDEDTKTKKTKGKAEGKEGTKKSKDKDKKEKARKREKSKQQKNKRNQELSEDNDSSDASIDAIRDSKGEKDKSGPATLDKDGNRKSDKSLLSIRISTSDTHVSGKSSASVSKSSKSVEVTKTCTVPSNRLDSECIPNSYPGYMHAPKNLAVIGSESGTYQSLCQLVRTGFQAADRILTMTPWGNYVTFRSPKGNYFLYSGCTCNPCRFRNVDLSIGTAGLLCFSNLHDLIMAIMKGKDQPRLKEEKVLTADEICEQYC